MAVSTGLPTALAVPLCVSFLIATSAPALIIDDFASGDFTLNEENTVDPTDATLEVSGLATSSVIGGVRFVMQSAIGTGASSSAVLNTAVDDAVVITPIAGADLLVNTRFHYDGSANGVQDTTGGSLGLDLNPYDFIQISAAAPSVAAEVRLTLYSPTPQTVTTPLVDGTTSIALADYTIGLSDIRAIRLVIALQNLGEIVIVDHIEAVVPEPGTGLLLGVGLLGFAMRRGVSRR